MVRNPSEGRRAVRRPFLMHRSPITMSPTGVPVPPAGAWVAPDAVPPRGFPRALTKGGHSPLPFPPDGAYMVSHHKETLI